jgi:RNA-dependent RNA polymerase
VLVTPTRVVLQPAQLEGSNRVLRHFKDFQDRFLRVSFQDEDDELFAGSLYSDNREPAVGILARVRAVLRHGLNIAGRHFVVLAFSESQFQ